MENKDKSVIVTFEQNEKTLRWSFTALFGQYSISCNGYKTRDECRLAFERLRKNIGL